MAKLDSARDNPKRRRRLASRGSNQPANDARPHGLAAEETPSVPPPMGRLERTRRLILAALRVWELKRKIHD